MHCFVIIVSCDPTVCQNMPDCLVLYWQWNLYLRCHIAYSLYVVRRCMYQICSGIVYLVFVCECVCVCVRACVCIVCHVHLQQVQSIGHEGPGSIILLLTAQSAVLCCIGDCVLRITRIF